MHQPPPQPAPAPTLPDELIEEIFLRLPPDEPASIVRASLANKLWIRLLTGPAFCGRYREFHGAPPMLGFFYRWHPDSGKLEDKPEPLFVSTTKLSALIPDDEDWGSVGCDPLDCRHGRLVIGYKGFVLISLVVFDPMMGCRWDLNLHQSFRSYGATVLCAVIGCDHSACHDGPFRVVFVGMDKNLNGGTLARVWLYSPVTGECSKPSSDFQIGDYGEVCFEDFESAGLYIEPTCPILVEDAIYFMLVDKNDDDRAGILKYDLTANFLSLIDAPLDVVDTSGATVLMAMKDCSLGFAYVDGLTLYVWSRQLGSDGVASWTECKVINLKQLLPILNPENRLTLIGSVEGRDIIFVTTDLGIYEINLKTLQWKKLWKKEEFHTLVPYMSFYHPEESEL